MNAKCRCCGRPIREEDREFRLCPYCGMYFFDVANDPAKAIVASRIAAAYREHVISNITDISLVSPGDGRLLRICDANECFERIVWSRDSFPPFSSKEVWNTMITLRMSINGKDRQIIAVNAKEEDRRWKAGVAIDKSLSLYTFFGYEDFHLMNGPYDLKISR